MIEPIDLSALTSVARTLDDLETARVSASHRLRQLTKSTPDADGQQRGAGLGLLHPSVEVQATIIDQLRALEKDQRQLLRATVRRTPFIDWIKSTRGVGPESMARLLAATGDPYVAERVFKSKGIIAHIETGPRSKREFLSYCGYGIGSDGRSRQKRRGESANWNADARTKAHTVATLAIRAPGGGPLYDLYAATKERELAKVDLGHAHARGVRAVAKRVLGDLFDEARGLHADLVLPSDA